MAQFDSKKFNPQAFRYLLGRVPNLKMNRLRNSSALVHSSELRSLFADQNGTAYATTVVKGLLTGEPLNYDGQTDITAVSTKTYSQGHVVVGRAMAWTEKDFSEDITGGEDFMANVAQQVAQYWDEVDQDILLAILKGIFEMDTTAKPCRLFVEQHTTKTDGLLEGTALNTAITKACGDNRGAFSLVFVHSHIATGLENLNLLKFLTYTDAAGITRDLAIATWSGRTVVIDDAMPFDESTGDYVSYILGRGAFQFVDVGVRVPHEMDRDPAKNGGLDTLYSRQRKVYSPQGISYEKVNQASLSPTNVELSDGRNWTLVHSGESNPSDRTFINHRAIHIARIYSKSIFTIPEAPSAASDTTELIKCLTASIASLTKEPVKAEEKVEKVETDAKSSK